MCQFDSDMKCILDKHAPINKKLITERPNTEWFASNADVILKEKKIKRKLEGHWRHSKLEIDRQIYVDQCNKMDAILDKTRSKFYQQKIAENASDQKELFKVVNNLTHKKDAPKLPSRNSIDELAEEFANFFTDKIVKIKSDLESLRQHQQQSSNNDVYSGRHILEEFTPATTDEVRKIILKSKSTTCQLDVMPTWLLKECLDTLLPVITNIVNMSLSSATMPSSYKEAVLIPLLKKAILDSEILNNFRPISNLKFLSKVIERIVAARFTDHLSRNHLNELMQSAYRKFHSVETALLRVQNDILRALDNHYSVLLILLDQSAAFDTVDHSLLLQRLSERFGVRGSALSWFKSYLSERSQTVCIQSTKSSPKRLTCGVPQGSVLGPLLFTAYTSPIGDIVRAHGVEFHCYADDTQLYLAFKPSIASSNEAKIKMEACVNEVRMWMATNFLKLNDAKTEMLIIHPQNNPPGVFDSVSIGDVNVSASGSARNIGVVFDNHLNLEQHVKSVTSKAFFQIQNVRTIRKYLSQETTECLVHAYITSRLDFCNSLLYGLPQCLVRKLQLAQNTAARLVTLSRWSDHITPVLMTLHWLPVHERITFKILLLVYKVLHGLAPQYLAELVTLYSPCRSLRSCDKMLLDIPRTKPRYGNRAFSSAGPCLWNSLPYALRDAPSVNTFKKQLKTFLYKQCYLE